MEMIYKVSQNTPKDRNVINYGKWTVMQKVCSLPAGVHETIDGKFSYTEGITAWEHVPGVPHFEFKQHAEEVMMELYKLLDHG
jgi:hypothetical protein